MHRGLLAAWMGVALGVGGIALSFGAAEQAGGKGASTQPTGPVKVKLTAVPLASTRLLMAGKDFGTVNGMLETYIGVGFGPEEREKSVIIAENKVTFALTPTDMAVKTGTNSTRLQPDGEGFRPMAIPVDKGRNYTLAFPRTWRKPKEAFVGYCSGQWMQGTLAGEPLMLYDVRCDGVYKEDEDAIRIGKPNGPCVLVPLNKFLATPTGLLEVLNVAEDGSEIELRRCTDPTSKLTVSFASAGLELQAAFQAEEISFLVTAGPRGGGAVQVPPGDYSMPYGMIYFPGGRQLAGVVSMRSPITKRPGGPETVAMGAPFRLVFKATSEGNKFKVSEIRVLGRAGEEYRHLRYGRVDVSLQNTRRSHYSGKIGTPNGNGDLGEHTGDLPNRFEGDVAVVVTATIEGFGAPVQGMAPLKPAENPPPQ